MKRKTLSVIKKKLSLTLVLVMITCGNQTILANENSLNYTPDTEFNNDSTLTEEEKIMLEMADELVESIKDEATYIGEPQFIEIEPSSEFFMSDIVTYSSVTNSNPLTSWVTFTVGHWGSYREYDGNRVAVSFQFFIDEAPLSSDYTTKIMFFSYGQQYWPNGSNYTNQQGTTCHFIVNNITPNKQSYRLRYETNAPYAVRVYVVALPFYV